MRTRPTSDGTDEDRLFRQARPARPADLLRARRQAAQRRAARARRAPAGGGQGRRPRDHGAQGARLDAGRNRAHARIHRLPQDHRARLGQAAEHLGRGRAQRPSGALSRDLSEGAGRPRRLAPGRPRLPDRAAHLGRRDCRQRIGGDGRRPGARRRARGLCALPAARPSRLCRHGGRLLLPEQHRHRRPAPAPEAPARGRARCRRPSRQRHAGHLLRARRRADGLDPRRSRQLLSLLLGSRPRDRRRQGSRLQPESAAAAGLRRRAVARGGRQGAGADPRLRTDRAGRRPGPRRQRKRPAAGPEGDRRGLPRHGRRRSPASACRPCWCRKAAISATISDATWCSSWPASRRAAHSWGRAGLQRGLRHDS